MLLKQSYKYGYMLKNTKSKSQKGLPNGKLLGLLADSIKSYLSEHAYLSQLTLARASNRLSKFPGLPFFQHNCSISNLSRGIVEFFSEFQSHRGVSTYADLAAFILSGAGSLDRVKFE